MFFHKPSLTPVCNQEHTKTTLEEIDRKRRYALAEIETLYEKIASELSVTDKEDLATLKFVVEEYKQIENSIMLKQQEIDQRITDFISTYGKTVNDLVDKVNLLFEYDAMTGNLDITIKRGE